VNSGVLDHVGTEVRREEERVAPNHAPVSSSNMIERWLQVHLDRIAFVVIAAGFAARIFAATRSYLNPDEALHYLILNQPSAFQAYKASLTNAHPPLIYLVLYAWHFLGRSELMLRLPSVLAGTAFCWAAFQWIKIIFGRAAALIGVILCAFSPALIALSAEVRAYALLLFCMGGALYFLARAFEEKVEGKSVRRMGWFTGFLYLAILSHYSALFFALALGLYVLARIADSQLPRKAIVAWAAGQAGAFAIYGFLYVTHISKIKTSIASWAMPYDPSYFHRGDGNIFIFTREKTLDIFLFLFGQRFVAEALVLSFLAGVAYLFARDLRSRGGDAGSRRLGILFLMPFAAVWGASVVGIYPYVGSRHTVFLAPFAIAAASFLLAAVSRQTLWAGLLIAASLMSVPKTSAKIVEIGVTAGNESLPLMAGAMNYMEQSIPRGSLVVVDYQSSLPITYYLCGPKTIMPRDTHQGEYSRFDCNGYSVVSLHIWKLIAESFPMQFKQMAQNTGLKPGDRIWVFQSGWGKNLGAELPKLDPKFRCLAPKNFGENISVIPFVVGPDFSPSAPSPGC
jgi:hypothetical protein